MPVSLSREQKRFIEGYLSVSRQDPRLVAAQLVAEEPAGARKPVGHSDQNWLNIGNTDSRWFPGASKWQDSYQAGRLSALWTQGKVSVPGFGRAAAGIVAFSRTAGQPLQTQIQALQHSGWASSGYPNLSGLVKQVGGGLGISPSAPSSPQAFTTQTINVLDRPGLADAQRRYALGQFLANAPRSPFDVGPRASIDTRSALLTVLPTTPPTAADFTRSVLQRIPQPSQQGTAPGLAIANGGKVILAPGADRSGVPTQPIVKHFVGLVAGTLGKPITITTGSNHGQITTSGNVSDHWTGHAADIGVPIDSQQGDMIAGHALLLLGVPRAQARRMAQQGGLYTITPRTGPLKGRRVQVIWKTYEGGDHHNHVHIGIQ